MKNITGFIVDITSKEGIPIEYTYEKQRMTLSGDEVFTGYFWQTLIKDDGKKLQAHITKTVLIDEQRFLCVYKGEAIFDMNDIAMTIRAKRGPASNNTFLPSEYDIYDTWCSVLP